MRAYYQIDGDNNQFSTLREAKHHVYVSYTESERIKYLHHCFIIRVVRGETVSITPIIIDTNGNFRFGKTQKF